MTAQRRTILKNDLDHLVDPLVSAKKRAMV
jgi:hypothetical protein